MESATSRFSLSGLAIARRTHVSRFTLSRQLTSNKHTQNTQNKMKESTTVETPSTPAAVPPDLSEARCKEFHALLTDIESSSEEIKKLPATLKLLREENSRLTQDLTAVRRSLLTRHSSPVTRSRGQVTDDCARRLAATFIHHCERSGKLEALSSFPAQRDILTAFARDSLGLTTRTALNTSDI